MSDSSNSTGSTGSSTNSWTLLSPEEAAIENVGPVDDGTESLGDVPSLSEEVAGTDKSTYLPGLHVCPCHQVCQETSPESSEGPVPSSPSRMSPLPPSLLDPPDLDLESQPPVIHDIVTSSPSDNEHLGAMPFVTNIDMGAPLDIPTVEVPPFESEESCSAPLITEMPISAEHELQKPVDVGLIPASPPGESQVFSAEPEVNIPTETLTATDPLSHVEADISFVPDSTESQSPVLESLVTEHPTDESPAPETVGSAEADEEAAIKNEPAKPSEPVSVSVNVKALAQYSQIQPGTHGCVFYFSLIFFFSHTLIYLQLCPRYKLSLFDHISQSKKEELDSALKALAASGDKKGEADLEKENAKLKEELSSLPELKKELETLRARVTELSQLAEEKNEKDWKPQKQNSHKEAWRKHQDEWESKKGERRMDREERRKEKPWHSRSPRHPHQHHNNDFWRDQEQKLQRNVRPQLGCTSVEDCASKEGLYPVELSEFEELLEGYLSKLERSSSESKDRFRRLTADYFEDGVFIHDRIRFSDFAEDVADILEDMVDVLEGDGKKDDDSLEEEMEEFEREALWKFAATA
uniref:Pre-B-cell leukemia homeobox interacting protein 1a n=1 Tax=Neolamprologus brichardi TaxID=32507 RepID=A0A3Q4HHH8_NEOBR